jgi:7-cyano-7-deazaguanine synthase
MSKVIAVFSGGLDSTTMVYDLINRGDQVDCVSFDYGQRHRKELEFAEATAHKLGLRHDVIDLSDLSLVLAKECETSLLGNSPVPEGHYAEENMKSTVVPNRNMIMLSIAGGIAVARDAQCIATAVHAGDHAIYPDCRPDFIDSMCFALTDGNEGLSAFLRDPVIAPYIYKTKADIAFAALQLDVPLHETWSCYKGGDIHCGKCGTCVERLEAIDEATTRCNGMNNTREDYDKTEYEDGEFWKEAVRQAAETRV